MKPLSTHIKINLCLGIAVIVLSFSTIFWHHQMYLLYKQAGATKQQNQQLVAMQKQLRSQYSAKISGKETKAKAVKILKMKPPARTFQIKLKPEINK